MGFIFLSKYVCKWLCVSLKSVHHEHEKTDWRRASLNAFCMNNSIYQFYRTRLRGRVDQKVIESLNLGSNSCSGLWKLCDPGPGTQPLWALASLSVRLDWYTRIRDLPNQVRVKHMVQVCKLERLTQMSAAIHLSLRMKSMPAVFDNLDPLGFNLHLFCLKCKCISLNN